MVEYIPILTTVLAVIFFYQIFNHYLKKPEATYLLWWSIGVATYGLGTLTESINAVVGWSELNTKAWYILGALLGGAPLAQGTVYLLLKKRMANILSGLLVIVAAIGAVAVMSSPVVLPVPFDGRLSGQVFAWQWVRLFSPFINIYAFIFLFGGAVYSAWKYAHLGRKHSRFLGNVFIAIGALLPGIGGTFTRMGYVEVLYITELIGLTFMYGGYLIMQNDQEISIHVAQKMFSTQKS